MKSAPVAPNGQTQNGQTQNGQTANGQTANGQTANGRKIRVPAASPGRDLADAAEAVRTLPATADAAGRKIAGDGRKYCKIGCVDHLSAERITGWAWDPDRPDEPVAVDILDGDTVALTIMADRARDDLKAAGIGGGRHGFEILQPAHLFPRSRHRIRIRRAFDGVDLMDHEGWIVRTRAGFDDAAADGFDQEVACSIADAREPGDLDHALAAVLGGLNRLVNARMALEADKQGRARDFVHDVAGLANASDWMREFIHKMQMDYTPLHFDDVAAPRVSIVIPVHNAFATTYNCLRSILEHPPEVSYEIVVVDDASTDETMLAAIVLSGAVRLLRNPSNQGFVRSCNAGAKAARGRCLMFLNNDTLVRDGWLDALVATFETVPNVGIAGAKLLSADGQLQEAGGVVWRLGDAWNWGRGQDARDPAYCYLRDADWVSGAALMIPAELFALLGGFDEHFAPGYYEDTDLAFRARQMGKRVVVQPASEVVHLEGVSAGVDVNGPGMKRYQRANQAKFRERWASVLAAHRFNGDQAVLEAERAVRKRAYFIDETVPTPDQDAGSNAALQHMIALMRMGYKVTFLPADNMARIDPYTANLQKIGIECLYAPYYWSVEEVFRKARVKPDLIYLHRYVNSARYATMARRYCPNAAIVYNVADLHFLRMERASAVMPDASGAADARDQRARELATMRDVGCVIVHSSYEKTLLDELRPGPPVVVVPWTVTVRPTQVPFRNRYGTAFVGGYGHPPNVDAATYLATEIVPLLRARGSAFPVRLIGSNAPAEIHALQSRDLQIMGHVPVLADALDHLRCTVVPLRYGAGVKGKVLESFAHGLPCVMTPVAAEGLDLPQELAWLVADSPAEFAAKTHRLHEDEALNSRLAALGCAYVATSCNADIVASRLRQAIDAADGRDPVQVRGVTTDAVPVTAPVRKSRAAAESSAIAAGD